jgi:HEAT repeat protein
MRAFAIKNVSQIGAAVRACAREEHRRAASMLLGYANRSADQIAQLVRASNDADSTVRNNAVRALGVLAAPSAVAAAGIQADALIELLNSGDWTDRNKAGLLFMRLTEGRRPALLAALARQAFVRSSRWPAGRTRRTRRRTGHSRADCHRRATPDRARECTGVEEIIAAAVRDAERGRRARCYFARR